MRPLRAGARPLRWAVLVGAVCVALALSWWLRPDAEVAAPDSEPLPAARTDLASSALAQWLADRAATVGDQGVPIADLSSRVLVQSGAMHEDGSWRAAATITWRYADVDPSAATAEVTVDLRTVAGKVSVVGLSRPGRVPVWTADDIRATRTGDTVVVTGAGIDHAAYVRRAERAVQVVARVVPDWSGPLVIEVPSTAKGVEEAMAATTGTYTGVAAVTASADGQVRATAPVHVLVNPEVMARLDERSAQIVLSHEATHVATGAVLTDARPLWLSEGFADYVALRDVAVPLRTSAGQIAALVRAEGVPAALPDASDLSASSAHFGAEYEASWQVCEQIVADAGEKAMVRLYDAVGKGTAVSVALRREVGYDVATLTQRWQSRLRALPGASR